MGKTRLLAEWAKRRREAGWTAGFLSGALDETTIQAIQTAEHAIVIFDYAESILGLDHLLTSLIRHPTACVRVVLAARHLGDWWEALKETAPEIDELLHDARPLNLAPVAHDEQSRVAAWQAAVAAFSQHLPLPDGSSPQPPDMTAPRYNRLLYVQMSALAFLLDDASAHGDLRQRILTHETRFWLRLTGHDDIPSRDRPAVVWQLHRVVAALTLRGGGGDTDTLTRLMTQVAPAVDTAAWEPLWASLSHPDARRGHWLCGLEPDLLGEHLVRTVLDDPHTPNEFLARVAQDAEQDTLTSMFVVLGRIEGEAPDTVRCAFVTLLAPDQPERALAATRAAVTLGEKTASSALGNCRHESLARGAMLEIAEELDSLLPQASVMLAEVGVRVSRLRLQVAKDVIQRAAHLNNLGRRLSALGDREEALEANKEAVELHRLLAAQRPDAFMPYLAGSLNNLGLMLSRLGDRERALEVTKEAVQIRRKLVAQRPDTFGPELASSLNNLGMMLSALGDREHALEATKEAVQIRRDLASQRPDAFSYDLATSLHNLAVMLSKLGDREQALDATRGAVEIYRDLATQRPNVFSPELAVSLSNLGQRLSESSRPAEARTTVEEAAHLLRPYFTRYPQRFGPWMRMILEQCLDLCGGPPPPWWNDMATELIAILNRHPAPDD